MNHSTMFDPSRWAKPLTGICFLGAIAVVLTIASSRSDAAPATTTPVAPLAQPLPAKPQLEVSLHVGPFAGEDAVHHAVADGAVAAGLMVT